MKQEPLASARAHAAIAAYGRLAPRYDRRWAYYIDATVRETLARVAVRPTARVLDVGCGTGALLAALAAVAPGTARCGVDASPEMLAIARQRLGDGAALRESPAERLPFPDASFELVVSTSAFHYFRDPGAALAEMQRVLVPAGRLVVTDWCDDFLVCRLCDLWLRAFDRAHFRTYGRNECGRLLARAGFDAIRIDRYKIDWLWGLMTATATAPGRPHAHDSGNA